MTGIYKAAAIVNLNNVPDLHASRLANGEKPARAWSTHVSCGVCFVPCVCALKVLGRFESSFSESANALPPAYTTKLVEVWPKSAELGKIWSIPRHNGRCRSKLSQCWARLARLLPSSSRVFPMQGTFDLDGEKLVRVPPDSKKLRGRRSGTLIEYRRVSVATHEVLRDAGFSGTHTEGAGKSAMTTTCTG